jgi:hypothetical protein
MARWLSGRCRRCKLREITKAVGEPTASQSMKCIQGKRLARG